MLILNPIPAEAGKRFALVIGANDYAHAPALQNAVADSRLVAATLTGIGFEVIAVENAGVDSFYEGLEKLKRLSAHAEVALVYFAGHGIEVDGKNYLLPVDAELSAPGQLRSQTVALETVLRDMEDARIDAKVVILDCCRDNPIGRSWMKTRSVGRGLGLSEVSDTDLPEASLILYSAGPGEVALDGTGSNSPFTEALSKRLQEPGKHILDAFYQVSDDVVAATNAQQEPWVKSDGAGRTFRTLVLVPAGAEKTEITPVISINPAKPVSESPVASLSIAGTGVSGEEAMGNKTTAGPAPGNPAPPTTTASNAISPAVSAETPVPEPAKTTEPVTASAAMSPLPTASAITSVGSPVAPASTGAADSMKATGETSPANVEAPQAGYGTAAPVIAAKQIELPSRGYFSNSEVFKNGPYEKFNDFTRGKILREAQGNLTGAGTPDGAMGKNTQTAIQTYQQSKSLPVTGLFDLMTLDSMGLSGRKEEYPPVSKPSPQPRPTSTQRYSSRPEQAPQTRTPSTRNSTPDGRTETQKRHAELMNSHAMKRIISGH